MNRATSPLIALLAILLLVVAGILAFGQGSSQPPSDALPSSTAEQNEPAKDGSTTAAVQEAAGEGTSARTAVARPAAAIDPSLRRAFSGFVGRVLRSDRQPAAKSKVMLYRFDVDVMLDEAVSLFDERSFEPNIDAGEALTDEEGRFAIAGVWPRGIYLLRAGIGEDNPTMRLVRQTPGPGETVDLGDIVLQNGAIVTGTVLNGEGTPLRGALVRAIDLPAALLQMIPLERFDPEGALIVHEGPVAMVIEMPAWVETRFSQLPIPRTLSAQDGTFRLTGIEPGHLTLIVTASSHLAHKSGGLRLKPGQVRELGEIRLRQGEEVRGRVVDDAGRPVAGAEVLVGEQAATGAVAFAERAGATDAAGRFSVFGFRGRVAGAARRGPREPWVVVPPQPVIRDMRITLPARHSLTLRLVSRKHRPVTEPELRLLPGKAGNGAVELGMLGFAEPISLAKRLERLDDGRYRINDLPRGRYSLLVKSTGHALRTVNVTLERDQQMTVELEPALALLVRVTDEKGHGIGGAAIYVDARGQQRVTEIPRACGRTGQDGRLVIPDLPGGRVRVTARHPAFGSAHAEQRGTRREIVLTLRAPGDIEGVLTERGVHPTPGRWTVLATARPQRVREVVPDMPRLALADAEGKFRLTGLQPGRYRVEPIRGLAGLTSLGGFMKLSTSSWLTGQTNKTDVFVRSRQVTHVTLDTNKQVEAVTGPAARVSGTLMLDGRPGTGLVVIGNSRRRFVAQVDANGRFDLGRVPAGNLWLRVHDPKAAMAFSREALWTKTVKVEASHDIGLDIDIRTSGLSGTVTDAVGAPIAGARVRISGVISEPGKHGASTSASTASDNAGKFHFERIPAGRYVVRAENERGKASSDRIEVLAGLPRSGVRLELQRTFKVSGRVDLDSIGKDRPDWMWMNLHTAEPRGQGTDTTWNSLEKDGSFKAQGLLPGDYIAHVWVNYKSPRRQQEFVQIGRIHLGTQDLAGITIRLQPQQKK